MSNSNKSSDKKAFRNFIFIIIGAMILGFIGGWFLGDVNPEAISETLTASAPEIAIITVGLAVVANAVLFLVSMVKYMNAKKLLATASEDDDEIFEKVDEILNLPLLLSNVSLVLNFLFFSVGVEYIDKIGRDQFLIAAALGIILLATFVFSLVWEVAMQNAVVKTVKLMNPEKKGSVFEMNFQKKWEESCDEGQKKMIYQAGYKAFSRVQITCIVLWLVAFMAQMFFDTGVMAVVCICVIFFVGIVTYSVEAMRLEHPKR